MTDQQTQAATYKVETAIQCAIGDYAHVNNYLTTQAATADPGIVELRRRFEEVNRRLAALEVEAREQVAVEVE